MGEEKKKILVVEDEEDVLNLLGQGLQEKGFEVDLVKTGEEAMEKAKAGQGNYALFLLDIVLPKMDGRELLKKLRDDGNTTPVLFLTAKDKVEDRVSGLEIGADDYIVKPFDFNELVARIHAVMRRVASQEKLSIKIGQLQVDRVERHVQYKGKKVDLTQREYQLLDFFLKHRGMVLTRDQISRGVWGLSYTGESNFVDVYVRHLRQKIWDKEESRIKTVRGKGYMFATDTQLKKKD